MNVLVVPEDFRKDQYLLKPIIGAMLSFLGKPNARVRVCKDPLLGGVREALKLERLREIIDRYRGMVQLFILVVDRDGDPHRRAALDERERQLASRLSMRTFFVAENAWQEIETWALAAQKLPKSWSWQDVRSEPDVKERYFIPYAVHRSLLDDPGEGRRTLGQEAARKYSRLRSRCPEDVQILETRIAAILATK